MAEVELAKLAQKLPALLVGHPVANAVFDPPLVTVSATAVAKFRDDLIRSLAIAGEAQVPLHSAEAQNAVVEAIYQDHLQRAADAAGLAGFVAFLHRSSK